MTRLMDSNKINGRQNILSTVREVLDQGLPPPGGWAVPASPPIDDDAMFNWRDVKFNTGS
jgi:hypothetical protein